MRHRLLKLLIDVRVAATSIQEYTHGLTEDDYVANKPIRRAVEREFEIIGEALRRMSGQHPEAFVRIAAAPQIIAFRNVLSHGYDIVEDPIVWSIIERRLPALLEEVRVLIAEEEARH